MSRPRERNKIRMTYNMKTFLTCFSCGRLGHSDLYGSTPGQPDEKGDLPFGSKLRAPDDRKKATSGDSTSKEQHLGTSNKRETKNSSTTKDGGVGERSNFKKIPMHT